MNCPLSSSFSSWAFSEAFLEALRLASFAPEVFAHEPQRPRPKQRTAVVSP